MSSITSKRKGASEDGIGSSSSSVNRANKRTRMSDGDEKPLWPEHFHQLFKVYKTLNTVLAFCSSRKHLATTFPVIRSSFEALSRQPLDLDRVAEIKALLPDLIKFAYIPKNEHLINEESTSSSKSSTSNLYIESSGSSAVRRNNTDEEEHVLVLDFTETKRSGGGRQSDKSVPPRQPPSSTLSPSDVKRLVLRRNDRFEIAINELLLATPPEEDAVKLLRAAAREHIPINPANIAGLAASMALELSQRLAIPSPQDRPSIEMIVNELEQSDWYKGQIVYRRSFDPRSPQIGALDKPLSRPIKEALKSARNIDSLYTHQAAAINSILNNRHVIVSTSTASGKSVIYQVPLLIHLERDPDATAIFIYPTKALAQDQKAALEHLLFACGGLDHIQVATYDGDTSRDKRADIRNTASVIFTNFDTIHASILPHEDSWRPFLKNLKLVAVDELHYYAGVFGSHVAHVMRRLRRICSTLGNHRIRFISCSATIADPLQHMRDIFGVEDIDVINNDGAPSGQKYFISWNPPLLDSLEPAMGRESPLRQATAVMRFLMKRGARTILFCKIRKICEQAMKTLRMELTSEGRVDILEKVMAYRGGYSQQDRRRIEREAFGGNLLGIVATNALELGVDIGALDAVIVLGFPFSLANLRQQCGRAGRRAQDALALLVADNNPIDQHYVKHPEELFSQSSDHLAIDLNSPIILEAHLQCASQEMPLSVEDEQYFGPLFRGICDARLVKDKQGWYHPHPRFLPYPSVHVSIRGIREEYYTVVDVGLKGKSDQGTGQLLEEIEYSRALFEIYEGGVFLHQGQTYIVQEISHDNRIAKVLRSDVNWTTRPRDFTNVDALQTRRIREVKGSNSRAFYGKVEIYTQVFGFFKLRGSTILDAVSLETPPYYRGTTGWWMDLPKDTLNIMRQKGLNIAEGIHAASHAILNRFDMQKDLKTECKLAVKEYKSQPSQRKRPARLMFYESAGTNGSVAANAFDHASDLIHEAFEVIESCRCEDGCNKCTDSAWCKEGNEVSSKLAAQVVLRGLLGLPIDLNALPDPITPYDREMDTIVDAPEVPQVSDDVYVEMYS